MINKATWMKLYRFCVCRGVWGWGGGGKGKSTAGNSTAQPSSYIEAKCLEIFFFKTYFIYSEYLETGALNVNGCITHFFNLRRRVGGY